MSFEARHSLEPLKTALCSGDELAALRAERDWLRERIEDLVAYCHTLGIGTGYTSEALRILDMVKG